MEREKHDRSNGFTSGDPAITLELLSKFPAELPELIGLVAIWDVMNYCGWDAK